MKKLAVIFLATALMVFLYGCSDDYYIIPHQDVSNQLNTTVNSSGRFSEAITFPSGASFNTTEDNTMSEGVVVNVTETMTEALGINPIGNPEYINVYNVTAELVNDGKRTEVTSLKKPLKLTLPTKHLGDKGICYVGIRGDKDSPWKYKRLSDNENIPASQVSLQESASQKLMPTYNFELLEMGVQLALFAYKKPIEEAKKDISVAEVVASPTTPLLTFDEEGKYLEDFAINVKLKGDNLSNFSDSDIKISIIYRTNNKTTATIKANGYPCQQTTEEMSDEAVAGKNYFVHVLNVSKFEALFGVESEVSFKLDLKGISKLDFPTDFIINVIGGGNSGNIIPFSYSMNVSYKAEKAKSPDPEPEPEPDPEPEPVVVYAITYDLAGGNLAEGEVNPESYGEASESITLNNPFKAGYTFIGWTGTGIEEGTASMSVTIPQGSTGDRNYAASWTPVIYTIVYELNGGCLAEGDANPESYDETSETITLKNPAQVGYTFAGWTGTELSAVTMEVSIVKGSTGDRTYTANWTPISYAITYNLNEGSLAEGVTNPDVYDITSETIVLNNPSRANYDFLGWTGTEIEEGTASMAVTIPQGSIGERSYVASWTPTNYTIDYDLNGGALADGITNPESYNVTSEDITLNNPFIGGYPFKGWSGTDLTGDENQSVVIAQGSAGNRTYTANWIDIPITYTITYELNEGILATGVVNPATYDVTSATIILNNPTREGYTFIGWSGTDLTGDENQTVTIAQGSFGDRTYTANWIPTSYAINYDLAEGTLADGATNPVSYDITSATITLNNPVREDYYFEGWTGTGIEEGTTSMTVTIPQGSIGERSYVASWTLMTIRLTIPGSSEVVTFQRPQHTDDFFMAIYEVTKSQYEAINGAGTDPSYHTMSSSHPVDAVDWPAADSTCTAFTQMLRDNNTLPEGYVIKLPTYEQWMYTCYAGSEDDYCFGVDGEQVTEATLADYAVYYNPSYTSPVGSKKPNYWGFYDMHGNVYEWILDNPPGLMIFGMHFKFGGSWSVNAAACNAWPLVISGSGPIEYDRGFRFTLVPDGE